MTSPQGAPKKLLLIAIASVLLLLVGAVIAYRSERRLEQAERRASEIRVLEDARERLLAIERDRMSALLTSEPFTGDDFGLSSRSEPLVVFVRTSGQQAWPRRLPVVRQEDLIEAMPTTDADLLRLVWHQMAQPSRDGGFPALLQRLLASSSPAASGVAAFIKLQDEWPSDPACGTSSSAPLLHEESRPVSQDLVTRATELLLTPREQQISAHRQWLRDQLISHSHATDQPQEAERLFHAALAELVGVGFSEEPLAVAWINELAQRFPEDSSTRAHAESLLMRLRMSRERINSFNDRRGSSATVGSSVVAAHFEAEWTGPSSEVLGVRLVLPPAEPTLEASMGSWTSSIEVLPAGTSTANQSVSLSPLYPQHDLTVKPISSTVIPWRSYWTTSLLGIGVLLAVVGVFAAVRGVSSRERALEAKSELLTTLSHQLKTPAANVRLFTETLGRKDITPADRERMQDILQEESLRLQDVLNRVLAYQAAAGPDLGRRETIVLRSLIEQRATRWMLAANAKQAELHLQLPDGVGAAADPDAILDALDNLVDNAFAAIETGGRVTVGYVAEGELVTFFVEDTGHGISDEDAPSIFQRFYRGRTRRSRAGGGSGLGLAIVASVAHRHGGDARIARTGPTGTRMELRIPGET